MITYKEIQKTYKELYGQSIKSCWIADVKRELKLTTRVANNIHSLTDVVYPCPDDKRDKIRAIILSGL